MKCTVAGSLMADHHCLFQHDSPAGHMWLLRNISKQTLASLPADGVHNSVAAAYTSATWAQGQGRRSHQGSAHAPYPSPHTGTSRLLQGTLPKRIAMSYFVQHGCTVDTRWV
jgi:hypothetical protein